MVAQFPPGPTTRSGLLPCMRSKAAMCQECVSAIVSTVATGGVLAQHAHSFTRHSLLLSTPAPLPMQAAPVQLLRSAGPPAARCAGPGSLALPQGLRLQPAVLPLPAAAAPHSPPQSVAGGASGCCRTDHCLLMGDEHACKRRGWEPRLKGVWRTSCSLCSSLYLSKANLKLHKQRSEQVCTVMAWCCRLHSAQHGGPSTWTVLQLIASD